MQLLIKMDRQFQNLFLNWMHKPAIVKQLQACLVLSLIINIFLVSHSIQPQTKYKPKPNSTSSKRPNNKDASIDPKRINKFIKTYIDYLFKTDAIAIDFLQKHSSKNLFEQNLLPQVQSRKSSKISSKFIIDDIALELLEDNQAESIIIGREIFNSSNYVDREITIELVLDSKSLILQSIPSFDIENL